MTSHGCTGDVETCPVCSRGRDAIEDGGRFTRLDEEHAIRRAEDRFERHIYGEDRDY